MAWKGTRPPGVVERDQAVLDYLEKNGPSSRNVITEGLNADRGERPEVTPQLVYLSLYRLRAAGRAKRCVSDRTNELLWTAAVSKPCP